MAAITLPVPGEKWLGDNPAVLKVATVIVGEDSTDTLVDVEVDTTAAVVVANIPAGIIIEKVIQLVQTAWSAGTTMSIGDCDTATQFLNATSVTTAGLLMDTAYGLAAYYAAADNIEVLIANAGAGNTAGKSKLFIYYHMAALNVNTF